MRFSILAEFFCGFAVLDDFLLRFCGFKYTPMPPSYISNTCRVNCMWRSPPLKRHKTNTYSWPLQFYRLLWLSLKAGTSLRRRKRYSSSHFESVDKILWWPFKWDLFSNTFNIYYILNICYILTLESTQALRNDLDQNTTPHGYIQVTCEYMRVTYG